ncbi:MULTISPECIES: DUF5606 family protein [Pedobacter]|uniref:DUF5606 domain-containing protein n=1 Tax=Pedobacter zeae TaxID=1737356 RepID=A0A7W6KEL5_9SPHI|nr:DUF5606 domain-containing protein [Pedobacter zeae]MBB4110353.1 hypothetical protein [Pedobacter zeae]GGH17463.1 hypothetical protein GCM10007422_40940 [Pedobacter zeae]
MNLRGIVAVSGRPGLFKLVGQNKVGYILESLDAQKTKIVANITNTKLASLEDITVYGEDEEIKLADIFAKISAKGSTPDLKGDLRAYFLEVAPNHDQEKVYASDMKKIITWYNLLKDLPLFTEEAPETPGTAAEVKLAEEKTADKKVKTSGAKATASAKATTKTSAPAKKASMTSKKGV